MFEEANDARQMGACIDGDDRAFAPFALRSSDEEPSNIVFAWSSKGTLE
jgi:hypothetical protein